MCVLYVSFGFVAMGSALLYILGPDCSHILPGLP